MASKKKSPKIRTIQNAKGEWKWHVVSPNGKKVQCGGETFKRALTKKGVERLIQLLINAELERVPFKK